MSSEVVLHNPDNSVLHMASFSAKGDLLGEVIEDQALLRPLELVGGPTKITEFPSGEHSTNLILSEDDGMLLFPVEAELNGSELGTLMQIIGNVRSTFGSSSNEEPLFMDCEEDQRDEAVYKQLVELCSSKTVGELATRCRVLTPDAAEMLMDLLRNQNFVRVHKDSLDYLKDMMLDILRRS